MDYSHENEVLQNKTMSNAESLMNENTTEEQYTNSPDFVDNRPQSATERVSSGLALSSPQSQQAAQLAKIANSGAVQRMGNNEEEEESVQMKQATAQKMGIHEEDEDESVQMKKATAQKMGNNEEEEESVQMKQSTAQKMGIHEEDEDESVQMKKTTAQKMGIHEEDEEESVQMKKSAAQLKSNGKKKSPEEVSSGTKSKLPAHIQENLLNETGHDLSNVNVYSNSQKPQQIGAHAYAQNNNIFLGSGQEKHMAHEATHIVQQREGRVKPTTNVNDTAVNDSPSLEREADMIGAKVDKKGSSSPTQLKEKSKKGSNSTTAQLNKDGAAAENKKTEEEKPHEPEHALEKNKFTDAQAGQIKTAINDAYSMAVTALGNVSYDNKYYKKWCDNSTGMFNKMGKPFRKGSVKRCFKKIVKTLEKEKITFKEYELNDGEKNSTYAYVYNNKLRNIYLGDAFWTAPANGQDSKSGTIIHELTHKLHGTKDHTYAEDEMREFAKDKPRKAVTNANNLEYFAEKVN